MGKKLTVIAWLWARTVKSPNPAFAQVDVPLASTFMLSTKPGKEAYVEPVIEDGGYRFTVKVGKPKNAEAAKNGTKLARGANFQCLMSGTPIAGDYIKAEGKAGRMGARLMAIVAEGDRGRVYLPPTPEQEAVAREAKPEWKPEVEFLRQTLGDFDVRHYGMTIGATFSLPATRGADNLLRPSTGSEGADQRRRARAASRRRQVPRDGGTGAKAYAEAVAVYLASGWTKRRTTTRHLRWELVTREDEAHFRPAGAPNGLGLCGSEPSDSRAAGDLHCGVSSDTSNRALGIRRACIQADAADQTI